MIEAWVPKDEYAKKLINQGMILGTSAFVYRWEYGTHNKDDKRIPVFVSKEIIEDSIKRNSFLNENDSIDKLTYKLSSIHGGKPISLTVTKWSHFTPIHADVSLVNASDELDIEAFKKWRPEFSAAEFVLEEGKYKVGREAEKMSKSKYNVVNPDAICHQYGADSLRMYEMFLGPLEQAKPWNTAGITGVHSFLKKMWKLYHNGDVFSVSDNEPTNEQYKILHKTIKKVEEDIENFSFNTSVSTFMIAVNELTAQQCNSKKILEPLLVLISPYAPHIAEELWHKLGHQESIATAAFPKFESKYLVESTKNYPVSFNGKTRFTMELPLDMSKEDIEAAVMAHEKTQAQLQGTNT